VALTSSRPSASVVGTIADVFPPGFFMDAAITAMGTEIRVGGQWLESWSGRFAGWPRDRIAELVSSLGYRAHDEIYQTPAKASFSVPRGEDQDKLIAALKVAGLPFQAIASGSDDLDILPPGAGKDSAASHLAAAFGIPSARVVAAGDSANDLAMFNSAACAIAVGNARPELLRAMPVDKSYHAHDLYAAGVLEGLRHFGILASED
jgi:HAD superfamily hydrolase (TIGR01484 family)